MLYSATSGHKLHRVPLIFGPYGTYKLEASVKHMRSSCCRVDNLEFIALNYDHRTFVHVSVCFDHFFLVDVPCRLLYKMI